MKLGTAIAEIMKREGIEILTGYPVNHLIEHAAAADIRPVMVRQERIGLHMADAISRVTSGRKIGAFCMQHGPGAENAYGGVAQAYGESVPILVMPMGYPRRIAHIDPNFNSTIQMRGITKSAEPIVLAAEVPNILRRAFTQLRNCDTCTLRSCEACANDMPRCWIGRTASSLNSRVNFRRSMTHLRFH